MYVCSNTDVNFIRDWRLQLCCALCAVLMVKDCGDCAVF